MQKVIEVCSRVEGHGNLNIYLQNDNISQVEFDISPYRGFENLLIGKELIDVPRIVSRICGLCHASQTIASCKAIENLYQVKPSAQSILIRRLLMTGELIKSHIMHYFFQSLPDLFSIFNIDKKIQNFYDLIKFDPQLTQNVYDLIKVGTFIDNIFGGRVIHLITSIPGGVFYNPSKKNILITQNYLHKSINNIEYIIESFLKLFSNYHAPIEFNLQNISSIGLTDNGKYDRYNGEIRIDRFNKKIKDFQLENYSEFFDKDPDLLGLDIHLNKNEYLLTGPSSRFQVIDGYGLDKISDYLKIFNLSWKNSILFSIFLQLIEIYYEIRESMDLLKSSLLNKKEALLNLKSIKNMDGIGVVEAPRGILIHHYHLNKAHIINQAKLFIATEIKMPLINKMITEYAQKLYEKEDIDSVRKKVQIMVRAFDPCISCATH